MKSASQIFCWLNSVKVDGHLPASCFKVAYQLAQKTNNAEHEKSGALVTWQSIPTLADATRLSDRMVRYAVRHLEAAGHVVIKTGRGPHQSNRYTLIQQNRQPVASFATANTGNPLPHSSEQKRQSDFSTPAISDTNSGNRLPPNLSINNSLTSARARASWP